jgi:hypothetical protein
MLQLDLTPDPDVPFFVHRTTLDGKDYDFSFSWNGRCSLWAVTISTLSGEVLTAAQVLRHGRNLLSRAVSAERPPGIVFAWSNTPSDLSPPKVGELGGRVGIYYASEAELA